MDNVVATTDFHEAPARVSEWRRFSRVFFQRKIVLFGLIILALLVLTAIFAPLLAPFSHTSGDITEALQDPNAKHWLGTDQIGRDTLSRLIYGSRTALAVGFLSVLLAGFAGVSLGLIAGFVGGAVGAVIMRTMDALLSLPGILWALFIASVLGAKGMGTVIAALSIATLPGYARVIYGLTLTVKENDYVLAERALGASSFRTMLRHILPNTFPSMIVLITLQLGALILAEAGLSFLGLGIQPPDAAWGAMVADGRRWLLQHPLLSIAPGVAIMLVVFAFNLVGDGLRDALDPRLRGII